ncbi:type IV conjugative transfer system protein TraE [Simkania negevensis]|uniref:Conjugal transfer pore protein TraE n=1 Tax=Simkania negevensis (strain ATCC VR-1471 / DSM 27360 / Z) TaxID=331113 RepID=F8L2Z2_SIMNZ|nr:type IV conjugative transfer system protein TraE [Simkania negevensis]CCB87838.1 conjugal transfer pore protein TraE [Simkania negevensis Z]
MHVHFFTDKIKRLITIRNVLLLALLAMTCAFIRLSSLIGKKEERVVIIPPAGKPYWIEKSQVSEEYLQEIGLYLTTFLVDRTPLDVDFKNNMLLEHVHAEGYHCLKKVLREEADNIKKNDHAFHFIKQRAFIDPEKLTYTVTGLQRVYIPRNKKAAFLKEEEVSYILSFKVEDGRLFLKHIQKENHDEESY